MPLDRSTHARTCRGRRHPQRLSAAAYVCVAACATLLGGPHLFARADLLGPLIDNPAARCEAKTKDTFAAIATDNPDNPRVTADGCGTAAALATCHVQGSPGPCRDTPECPDAIVTIEDACNAANEAMSCCVVLYRRACDTCPPEPFACGQFCSNTLPGGDPVDALAPPLTGRPLTAAAGGSSLGAGGLMVVSAGGAAPASIGPPAGVGAGSGMGPGSAEGGSPAAEILGSGGEGVVAPEEASSSAAAGLGVWRGAICGRCGAGSVAGVCGCGAGVATSALVAATCLLGLQLI